MRLILVAAVLLLFPFAIARAESDRPPSPHETPVTAWLNDGRVLVGLVDSRTDDSQLWLRVDAERLVFAASCAWEQVQRVRVIGAEFSGVNFQAVVANFVSVAPEVWPAHEPHGTLTIQSPAVTAPFAGRAVARVVALAVEAQVANWDRDAESDGIELRILPQSFDGQLSPVSGALSIELIGRSHLNIGERNGFPTLGRWTQVVRDADFAGPAGAVYRLPFTHGQPDFDPSVLATGMVHVRLHARGQGHFDATVPVRVRTYNPLRDQLLEQGRHHDTFGRYRSRHW